MAIAFAAFFQITKHDHGISTIAPFVNDPYDAVGSFGVQLAGLAAALALVRAIAPDPGDADVLTRAFLVGRACATAILAVGVSLAADGVALVRHQSDWASAEGGAALGLDWLAIALLTTVIGWFLRPMLRISDGCSRPHWQAAVVPLLVFAALFVYPEQLRSSVPGEVMTVMFGAVCLFVPVRALTRAAPAWDLAGSAPDLLDLAWQVACWAARRSTYASKFVRLAEHAAATRRIGTVIAWINPRVHQWNAVALVALTSGALLALTQVLLEEGVSDSGHLWMVVALFVGLEAFAVALGYALLADVLVLFRNEGRPRRDLAS